MPNQDAVTRLNAALQGRYRIERPLGEGGMATVYLADDLRHERKVALKVLKPELAAVVGAERFLAEIKTTANLQHPHILPLFDSGEADSFLFYVMPYVEGETLRDRLEREKQLPVDEALGIATAVAHALQVAHDHGVIHRDIKPGNILLSRGEPLVADFGIALAVGAAGGNRLTETGLSMGTPYYMSPEQATGDQMVGPAADVYALACVLYEMLVGEPPYLGNTAQAVLGKIIQGLPVSATAARKAVPVNVDAAIRKALEKLPADRFTGANAFAKALADPGFRHGHDVTGAAVTGVRSWKRAAVGSGAVALLSTLGLVWALLEPDPPRLVSRSVLIPPAGIQIQNSSLANAGFAVSPSGRTVVFVDRRPDQAGQLYRQDLDQLDAVPIPGGVNAFAPFFSPDGEWIGYFDSGEGALRKIRLDGSQSQTLASVPGPGRAGVWGTDGAIVLHSTTLGSGLSNGSDSGLWRVPDSGGELEHIPNTEGPQLVGLSLLPGGRTALGAVLGDALPPVWEIVAVSLETGERTTMLVGSSPQFVDSGHLIFWRAGTLWAVSFDPEGPTVRSAPTPIAEDVAAFGPVAEFAVGGDLLFYREGIGSGVAPTNEFVWVSRGGQATPVDPGYTFTQGDANVGWRLSPDETRIVFNSVVDGNDDIRIKHLPDGPEERITFTDAPEVRPFWNPDGRSVSYFLGLNIWSKRADGTGQAELVLDDERGLTQGSWSPDGTWLVFRSASQVGGGGLGQRDILGFRPGVDTAAVPLLASTRFAEQGPSVSPNGRWLAYSSDETGREEIFVRPFPNVDAARVRVSTDGGAAPLWAKSGDEIFFVDQEGRVLSAGFDPVAGEARAPQVLFTIPEGSAGVDPSNYFYDVTSDGQRFLMARNVGANNEESPVPERLVLVQNFTEELRRVVPVD